MGFKPSAGKLVVELLDDYRKFGIIIPAVTKRLVGVGRIFELHKEDEGVSDFDAEYAIGDVVVFELDGLLEIKIGTRTYHIIDKYDLFGKLEPEDNDD